MDVAEEASNPSEVFKAHIVLRGSTAQMQSRTPSQRRRIMRPIQIQLLLCGGMDEPLQHHIHEAEEDRAEECRHESAHLKTRRQQCRR
jgi:hypothetical protein